MAGDDRDDDDGDTRTGPAWHERTSTLLGASAVALVVLILAYYLISALSRDEPEPTRQYFMDPTSSGTGAPSGTRSSTSTTETITSTSPPVTTDINPGESGTSGSSTTTSGTSGSDTPTTSVSRVPPHTRDDYPSSSRTRPRLNQTRTLYPPP